MAYSCLETLPKNHWLLQNGQSYPGLKRN